MASVRTVEDGRMFKEAVKAVLQGWTALQLAVKHGFGGQDSEAKALWMVDAIHQWFSENSDIEPYEVEDFLADVMSTEFDTVTDDGSLSQVSKQICQYFRLCQDGKQDVVQSQISKLPIAAVSQCVSHNSTENDEEEEMEDDEESEDAMREQLSEMSLSEEPVAGASSLPIAVDQDKSEEAENNENDITKGDQEAEDSEWTVVQYIKGKKKPR